MEAGGSKKGSLVIVGLGIRVVGQMTVESMAWIRSADRVFYLVVDPVAAQAIRLLNPANSVSLSDLYKADKLWSETYRDIVELIMASVRDGWLTCVAVYGHPSVVGTPFHAAVVAARKARCDARILPAVSAEDCLFAELEIDPGVCGCQSYEATDFLRNKRVIDPSSGLVLWQAGRLGETKHRPAGYSMAPLKLLAQKLADIYGATHQCIIYQAADFPGVLPTVVKERIADLPEKMISPGATLYIGPSRDAELDHEIAIQLDEMMAESASEPVKKRRVAAKARRGDG